MDKTHLVYIITKLKHGRYSSCIKYIEENELMLEHEEHKVNKLNMLFCIAHGLTSTSESPENVVRMLKMLRFKTLDGDDLSKYLGAVYHILKHVMNLGNLELIKDLEYYIKPPFTSYSQLNNKHLVCFQCLWTLLHNNLLKVFENNSTETIYTYCKLLIDLTLLAVDDRLPRIEKYFQHLMFKEYSSGEIKKLCAHLLESIDTINENSFKELSSLLCSLCKGFLVRKEYGEVRCCWMLFHEKLVLSVREDELRDVFDRVLKNFHPLLTSSQFYSVDFLNDYYDALIDAQILKQYMDLLIPIMVQLLLEFIKTSCEDAAEPLSSKLIAPFFKVCNELLIYASNIDYKCCCDIRYNVSTVGNVILIESHLFKYLSWNKCVDHISFKAGLWHFNKSLIFFDTMKNSECSMLERLWIFFGTAYYKIGEILYHAKNPLCFEYLQTLTKAAMKFGRLNNNLVKNALYMLAIFRNTNKCFKDVLCISALKILLYPDNTNDVWKLWVKAKHGLGPAFDDTTIISVLNDNETQLKNNYYEDFKKITNQEKIVQLLKLELDAYKKHWPFIIPKHLLKLKEHVNHTELGREIATIDYLILIEFERSFCGNILNPCIEHTKKRSIGNCESYLLLAYFNFLKYKFSYNVLIEKNDKDLECTALPKSKNEFKLDADKKCDINPGYLYLQISASNELREFLGEALRCLKMFNGVSKNQTFEDKICVFDKKDSAVLKRNLIITFSELAYEFKMHCDVLSFLDTMFATLELIEVSHDFESVVRIKTGIIEHLRIDSEKFLSLKGECEGIIKRYIGDVACTEEINVDACVEKNNEISVCNQINEGKINDKITTLTDEKIKNTILCRYYTSLSLAYAKSSEIESATNYYKQASQYLRKFENTEDKLDINQVIEKVRFLFLEVLLANTGCNYSEVYKHDALNPLFSSYFMVVSVFKTEKRIPSELLSFSLEALDTLLSFYTSMRLPREVSTYGNSVYDFIQKMALPFWVAKFTVYLAWADIMSCKYVDCESKLEKASKILGLGYENISTIAVSYANPEGGDINLFKSKIQLPQFATHQLDCDCFPCKSVVYKDLIMQKIHLDALLHDVHNDPKTALELFEGVAGIYERELKNPINLPNSVVLNKGFYSYTYDQYMLDYTRFQWKSKETKKASMLCEELMSKMKSDFNKNQHLHNEVLTHLAWVLSDGWDPVVIPKNNIKEEKTPVKEITSTPSPVLVSPHVLRNGRKVQRKIFNNFISPETLVPKSYSLKMIRKNLTDDLNEEEAPKSKELKSARKGKQLKIFCDDVKPVLDSGRKMGLRRFLDGPATPQPTACFEKKERGVKSTAKFSKSAAKPPIFNDNLPQSRKNLFAQRLLFTGEQKTENESSLFTDDCASTDKETFKGAVRKYTRIKEGTKKPEVIVQKPQRGRPKKVENEITKTTNDTFDRVENSDLPKENIFDQQTEHSSETKSTPGRIPILKLTNECGQDVDCELEVFKSLMITVPDKRTCTYGAPSKEVQSDNKKESKEPGDVVMTRSSRLKKSEDERNKRPLRAAAKKYMF